MKNSKKLLGLFGLFSIVLFTMSFNSTQNKSNSGTEYAYVTQDYYSSYLVDFKKCGEGKCGTDAKAKKEKKCGDGKMKEGKNVEKKCGEGKCGDAKFKKAKKGEKKCGEGKCGDGKEGAKKSVKNESKSDKNAKCGAGKCGMD